MIRYKTVYKFMSVFLIIAFFILSFSIIFFSKTLTYPSNQIKNSHTQNSHTINLLDGSAIDYKETENISVKYSIRKANQFKPISTIGSSPTIEKLDKVYPDIIRQDLTFTDFYYAQLLKIVKYLHDKDGML